MRQSQSQVQLASQYDQPFSNKNSRQTTSINQIPKYQNRPSSGYSRLNTNENDIGQEFIQQKEEILNLLKQNKPKESLQKTQNLIEASREFFGRESQQFKSIFNESIQALCDHSVRLLGQNQFESAIDILSTCNQLTKPSLYHEQIPEKRLLVLNNFGCVFRKMGRLGKARNFLEEAYEIVQKFPQIRYSGVTYLNLCAVLSQAGMHDRAIEYAKQGLMECQKQLLETVNNPYLKSSPEQIHEKVKFTAISFHNVGIEEEHFKIFDKAKENFRQSYLLFEEYGLSLQDPLYSKFKSQYQKCVSNSLELKNTPPSINQSKSQFLDRPKSANLPQFSMQSPSQQGAKNKGNDGFYFSNNKLVNRNANTENTLPKRSKVFPSQNSETFKPQQQNFFLPPENYNNDQFPSPSSSKQMVPHKSLNNSTTSRRESERPDELRKEIHEMNLIGILNWSDSEGSEEDVAENKQSRIEFIKQLQSNILFPATNEVNQQENKEEKRKSSSISEKQQTTQKEQNEDDIEEEYKFDEDHEHESIHQSTQRSEIKQKSTHDLPSSNIKDANEENKEKSKQDLDKSGRIKTVESEKNESKKNLSKQGSLKSNASSPKSPKSQKSSQQPPRSSQVLQKSIKLNSQQELDAVSTRSDKKSQKQSRALISQSSIIPEPTKEKVYGEKEETASFTIQKNWKKIMQRRQLRQRCILENKKKLILQYQNNIKSKVRTIQKSVLRFLATKRWRSRLLCNDVKGGWILCSSQAMEINIYGEKETPNEYDFMEEENKNQLKKLFWLHIYHSKEKENIKFSASNKDKKQKISLEAIQEVQAITKSQQTLSFIECSIKTFKTTPDLKILATKLAPFLIIQGNVLKVYLECILQNQIQEQGQYLKPHASIEDQEHSAIKIQAFHRGRAVREKELLKKEQTVECLRKWNFLHVSTAILFELLFMKIKQDNKFFFNLFDAEKKRNFKYLYIENKFSDFFLHLNRNEIVQDYFDIELEEKEFQISDFFYKKQGLRLPNASDISQTVIPENVFKDNLKSIIKIQANIRGINVRKHYQIIREAKRREHLKMNKEEFGQKESNDQIDFICKCGYIYQGIEPFLLKLYYKESNQDINLFINKEKIQNDSSVMVITCISIDKKTLFTHISPIRQKLQLKVTREQVDRYGSKVLKYTILKLVRNQLKIVSPNLQLVMQESKNEILRKEGKEVFVSDPDFDAKTIYNQRTMAQKRNTYKSLVNFCNFDANQSKNLQPSSMGEMSKRTIYFKYHNFQDKRKVEILQAKGFKDHASLKKKALLDFPSSEFSKLILPFMDQQRFNFDDAAPVKPKIDATVIQLNLECSISQIGFSLDIYYDVAEKQVIVISQALEQLKAIGQLIVGITQFAMIEWNLEEFKENMIDLLLKQLRQKNFVLYFEENKAAKRKQEAALISMNQATTSVVNSVQEKKNQEKEQQLQVFLFNIVLGLLNVDVLIHTSEYQLRLNVSQKNVTNNKTTIILPLKWFSCNFLKSIVDDKSSQELSDLFYPLFCQLSETLNIKYEVASQKYTFNLEETKMIMPLVIRNFFALKIQKKIIMKLQRNKFKYIQRFCAQKEILLSTEHTQAVNVYFEKRWYLVKDNFILKVIIERYPKAANRNLKKVFAVNLLEMKKVFTVLHNSKQLRSGSAVSEEEAFLTENKWTEIQGIHSKEYYQKIFAELINYLNQHIQIVVMYSKIYISMSDERIPFIEEKTVPVKLQALQNQKKKKSYDQIRIIMNAVCSLQRVYRKFKRSEWQQLKGERKKETESMTKMSGIRVKRAFKEIDGSMFIINVYQKQNLFIFDLILYLERRQKQSQNGVEMQSKINSEIKGKKKKQLRGQYEYDPNSLLNTGAQTIPEYLLDRISIRDEDIIFSEEVFQEFHPNAYQNVKKNESEMDFLKLNTSHDSEMIRKALEANSTNRLVNKQQGQSNIASNLVNYQFQEEEGKQFIYNVIYTGQKPQADPKQQQEKKRREVIQEEQQIILNRPQERLDTEENENSNIVKINVDLNELKKLYPTMDSQQQGLMKVIGEQLIDGIKLNDKGQVQINQSKLNPKCIEVEENTVNMVQINKRIQNQEEMSKLQQQEQNKQITSENKKILLKQTRFFSKSKYLILIYIIERKVKKIVDTAFDTVFEEYEVLYQVNGINLANKNFEPIIWEVTPEEVLIISEGIKDNMERARFLMRRVQIFNQKIIFTVLKKQHLTKVKNNPNLIIYYEQGLIPIQNHFKNRRFRRNYQLYLEEIRLNHANIVHKCIPEELRSLTQYYLLACIDKKESKDKWEIVVWDMVTFERYSKDVKSSEFFTNIAEFGKQITVEFIAKFIEIDPSNSELAINQGLSEYFKKYREELKKRKANRDLVEKKKQNYLM